MKIKFPARYYGKVDLDNQPDEAIQKTLNILENLGWRIIKEEGNLITAKSGVNWKSWGELIQIEITEKDLLVESKCSSKSQCFDWGRNKDNVLLFLQSFKLNLQLGDEQSEHSMSLTRHRVSSTL